MPQPKQPNTPPVMQYVKAVKAHQQSVQVYNREMGDDLVNKVLELPGLSEIFDRDDERYMLAQALSTTLESTIRMVTDNEMRRQQATEDAERIRKESDKLPTHPHGLDEPEENGSN